MPGMAGTVKHALFPERWLDHMSQGLLCDLLTRSADTAIRTVQTLKANVANDFCSFLADISLRRHPRLHTPCAVRVVREREPVGRGQPLPSRDAVLRRQRQLPVERAPSDPHDYPHAGLMSQAITTAPMSFA